MTPEQGFLDAIHANPGDDVNRLVYADWLDDHGDRRGAYLRLELALAHGEPDHPGYPALQAEMQAARKGLDPRWVNAVGRAYDLVLLGYEPAMKIPVIKAIRRLTWAGLAESKIVSESLPAVVLSGVSRVQAEAGKRIFSDFSISARTMIRLSRTAPSPPAMPLSDIPGYALLLWVSAVPWHDPVADLVQQVKGCDSGAAWATLQRSMPTTVHVFATEEEALRAAEPFRRFGVVEVWPAERFQASPEKGD